MSFAPPTNPDTAISAAARKKIQRHEDVKTVDGQAFKFASVGAHCLLNDGGVTTMGQITMFGYSIAGD